MQLSRSAHVDTFCRDNLPPFDTWPELLFDLPDVRYPERLNCAVELLDTTISTVGGDRRCLLAPDGRSMTYDDVRSRSDQLAGLLVDGFGLVPGNRVLLRGPNNPELVVCWLAVLRAGGVVVTTMPLLRPGELSTVHEIAKIDVALCDHRFVDDLLAADMGAAAVGVYGDGGPDDVLSRAARRTDGFAPVDTAADDIALLAFTSGTTGRPKATMHFHRDVLANADTFSRHVLKPRPDDLFTGTPPLAFTFGLGGLVVFPLRVGAASLLVEKASPDELADLICDHGVTTCFTAPTAYRALLTAGNTDRLSGLRSCVSAGEHLPAATWHAFCDATGVRIIDGIGSTEMLHIFVSSAEDEIRPGSTGLPVPGYRATILGPDGQELPDGEVGRLGVKGPTGCRYLADDRQSDYVQGGWNITGDTFMRDEDGYFWYQARSDDMIISAGYNIAGPEVEEALLAHDDVAECAVIGVPDHDRGSIVKAFVVLAEGALPSGQASGQAIGSESGTATTSGLVPGTDHVVGADPATGAEGPLGTVGALAGGEGVAGGPEGLAGGAEGLAGGAEGLAVTGGVVGVGGPTDAERAKAKELQDFVKARIAPYKYPRAVEFVTELPRTSTGKLQRFRLREPTAPATH